MAIEQFVVVLATLMVGSFLIGLEIGVRLPKSRVKIGGG